VKVSPYIYFGEQYFADFRQYLQTQMAVVNLSWYSSQLLADRRPFTYCFGRGSVSCMSSTGSTRRRLSICL